MRKTLLALVAAIAIRCPLHGQAVTCSFSGTFTSTVNLFSPTTFTSAPYTNSSGCTQWSVIWNTAYPAGNTAYIGWSQILGAPPGGSYSAFPATAEQSLPLQVNSYGASVYNGVRQFVGSSATIEFQLLGVIMGGCTVAVPCTINWTVTGSQQLMIGSTNRNYTIPLQYIAAGHGQSEFQAFGSTCLTLEVTAAPGSSTPLSVFGAADQAMSLPQRLATITGEGVFSFPLQGEYVNLSTASTNTGNIYLTFSSQCSFSPGEQSGQLLSCFETTGCEVEDTLPLGWQSMDIFASLSVAPSAGDDCYLALLSYDQEVLGIDNLIGYIALTSTSASAHIGQGTSQGFMTTGTYALGNSVQLEYVCSTYPGSGEIIAHVIYKP